MSRPARCRVNEKREAVVYAQLDYPSLDLEVEWDSGDEDRAIRFLTQAFENAVSRINAARPAAASTPQEGTTP